MGNVIAISLYEESESDKEALYEHFRNENLDQKLENLLSRPKDNTPFTEIREIDPVKAHVIDFVNQNLNQLGERKFTQLLKYSLNELHAKNPKAEFKFVFVVPFSKLGLGFSAVKSLLESGNRRVLNSAFLLVTNDTAKVPPKLSDKDIYQKALEHPEVASLQLLSEKDSILLSFPKKQSYKDNFLRAIRISSGVQLNNYDIDKVEHRNDGKHLIIGDQSIELRFVRSSLSLHPKIEEAETRLSTLSVGMVQRESSSVRQNNVEIPWWGWILVLCFFVVLFFAIVYVVKGNWDRD